MKNDFLKLYSKVFLTSVGIIGTIIGIVSFFFTLESIIKGSVMDRLFCLVIGLLVLCVMDFVITVCISKKSSVTIYKKEKTNIKFEYLQFDDITKTTNGEKTTIVIPVNTYIPCIGDAKIIKDGSIHKEFLNYLSSKGILFDDAVIRCIHQSNGKISKDKCRIGDWFILNPEDFENKTSIKFILVAVCNLKDSSGKKVIERASKDEYFYCIQTIINCICEQCDIAENVYIPLIGAENANIGKSKDIMFMMQELLMFNKGNLRQHIHIFLNEKYKDETPLYALRKHQ